MDQRNIKNDNSVMMIETYACRPCTLTLFFILFIALAVLGGVLSALLPDEYITDTISTMKCKEDTETFNDRDCTGVNVLHAPFATAVYAQNKTGLKYNKLLFGRPRSSHESVGVTFPLHLNVTTTDNSKTHSKIVSSTFRCIASQPCNEVLLLRFDNTNYEVSVAVSNQSEATAAQEWTGDFEFITRYDNMKFESITIIWRYISAFLCIIILLVKLVGNYRAQKTLTSEQKNFNILLVGVLIYANPLYLFNIFYRGSFWTVVDEVFSMIGVCTMMIYPLLALGGFITSKITILSFYVPRYFVVGLYFIFQLVVEIYPAIKSRLDPDVDVFTLSSVRTFSTLSLIVFLIWAIYFIYNIQRCIIVTKQHPKAIKGRYRAVICWIILISLSFHLIQALTYALRSASRGSLELTRLWLATMLTVSLGILLHPTRRPRQTSTSLSSALHPKRNSVRSQATEEAMEEAAEKEGGEKEETQKEEEYNVDLEGGFSGDVSEDRYW